MPLSQTEEKDSDLLKGLGDVEGLNVVGSVGYAMQPFKDLSRENTLRATFADSHYNNTFFGISREQSKKSRYGYHYYDAGMGIKDMALTSTFSYQVTDNIILLMEGEYKLLSGPAANSPLVKAGTKNQFYGLIGIGYVFK